MSRRKPSSSNSPANRKPDRKSKLRGGLRQPTRRGLRCESLERRELLASDIAGLMSVDCGENVAAEVAVVEDSAETDSAERSRESTRAPEGEQSVLNIRFDFSLDTSNFFQGADGTRKKELLDLAAKVITRQLADTLDAIPSPPSKFTWAPVIKHPVTGRQFTLPGNPVIPANEILVYAGGRNLTGLQRAEAGPGSFNFNSEGGLTQQELDSHIAFKQLLDTRGELGAVATPATDFAPITGSIAFDVDTNWNFDDGTAIEFDEFRFLNFAIHELAHVLGYGIAPSWAADVVGGRFQGSNAVAAYTGKRHCSTFR